MARVVMMLIGLALLALGVWLAIAQWPALRAVLLGVAAILLILFGLGLVIFGISELAGAARR